MMAPRPQRINRHPNPREGQSFPWKRNLAFLWIRWRSKLNNLNLCLQLFKKRNVRQPRLKRVRIYYIRFLLFFLHIVILVEHVILKVPCIYFSLFTGDEIKKQQEFIYNSKNCLEAMVELAASSGVELPCIKTKTIVMSGKNKIIPYIEYNFDRSGTWLIKPAVNKFVINSSTDREETAGLWSPTDKRPSLLKYWSPSQDDKDESHSFPKVAKAFAVAEEDESFLSAPPLLTTKSGDSKKYLKLPSGLFSQKDAMIFDKVPLWATSESLSRKSLSVCSATSQLLSDFRDRVSAMQENWDSHVNLRGDPTPGIPLKDQFSPDELAAELSLSRHMSEIAINQIKYTAGLQSAICTASRHEAREQVFASMTMGSPALKNELMNSNYGQNEVFGQVLNNSLTQTKEKNFCIKLKPQKNDINVGASGSGIKRPLGGQFVPFKKLKAFNKLFHDWSSQNSARGNSGRGRRAGGRGGSSRRNRYAKKFGGKGGQNIKSEKNSKN